MNKIIIILATIIIIIITTNAVETVFNWNLEHNTHDTREIHVVNDEINNSEEKNQDPMSNNSMGHHINREHQ
jgi:hypothetical protein